jgi:tRNA dimethylallyltransferase
MPNLMFCLMGPTASGKTALACELVQHLPVEIISVDSAMIYREMTIGTAKPDAKTLAKAPHHLIDILNPPESYSAAHFCEDVANISAHIYSLGKIPLLVGGTMMYFRALQQGLSSLPEADENIRNELLRQADEHGWAYMHQLLAQVDPLTATRIHPNDTQRIQRALEVYQLTKKPLSTFLEEEKKSSPYQFVNFSLMPANRAWLHQRIDLRFEQMLKEGLIEEVEGLMQKWQLTLEHPSMRSVGYRQVLLYLQGEYDAIALSAKGSAATRQLAKRQLTWLRHWPNSTSITAENPANAGEIMAIIQQILDNFA